MKKIRNISYAALACFAITFSSCTQNEDMTPTLKGLEINATFTVGGVQTRVNTLEKGNSWENNDDLKVLLFTDDYISESAVLDFDGKTKTWSHSRLFRWKDDYSTHNILAVHPSNYDFEKYELPLEQKTLSDLKSADLINGYLCQTPDWFIEIPMSHRMSLVTITYHVGTADYPNLDIEELQVYPKSTKVTFKIDQVKKEITMNQPEGNPNSDWITACKHDNNQFSAIVIPDSYAADDTFLKFKIGDKNFYAKMKINTDFEEGHRYTYKLDVGKDKVKLTQISVDDLKGWDSNNEEDLK
ncbi:fimbrillin family protein [Prevotella sp.]|uniref:fimbrillin family protein n=1 Tax=Prevotella sp. TaxID=59823 RepID=UPI0027E3B2BA|nr:fimbrillin family protein [Prevotella sp.]